MATIHSLTSLEEWQNLWAAQGAPAAGGLLIFKRSPRCSTSFAAEDEFKAWARSFHAVPALRCFLVDVVMHRPVSRAIAADTGVRHESPQALLLGPGQAVLWHDSHQALTQASFQAALSAFESHAEGK